MHRDDVELFDAILRFMIEARKVTQRARLRKIGARRSTGTAMSPGRRAGLGGTRAPAREARVQHMLPFYGKCNRRAGFEPGGFSAHLSHAGKLPAGLRSVSHVAHQRDAQFAGGSLPAHAPRSRDGFDRRRHAGARRKAFAGANASELSAQLQRGLARLSPELREAVILRDLQGLEYNEIQSVLEVPEGTVKSRINRGRIELARVLEEMGVRPS